MFFAREGKSAKDNFISAKDGILVIGPDGFVLFFSMQKLNNVYNGFSALQVLIISQ